MTTRIVVLMGGLSAEREVSLISGAAVSESLRRLGYLVTPLDVGQNLALRLSQMRPYADLAFNALHGRYGEDGCVQGLCELLQLPYTHSGLLASALAMDKPMAKRLFADAGIPVAESVVVDAATLTDSEPLARPYVIKPINEGSSVGVRIVSDDDPGPAARNESWPYGSKVMVERYVPGRELTVAVMGERALGVTEIRPREGFYDYTSKYTAGRADHLVPAPVPEEVYREALRIAKLAHTTLGCRGVSRADMRYDDSSGGMGLRLLEINTQPGMTPLSLVPELAAHAGIDFDALVRWMVEDARCAA